ncbi:hypothetical protein [Paraburkholderia panacisoli]|uniref:hypothetical protein n=1 Tax=Paraburkholderia panacisoli TaxID=2603818 RepID=UPI00165FD8B0|nr:hypothetical protein [Paraburkholderia panacisoli]
MEASDARRVFTAAGRPCRPLHASCSLATMLLEDIEYEIAHLAKNPASHSTAGLPFRHD